MDCLFLSLNLNNIVPPTAAEDVTKLDAAKLTATLHNLLVADARRINRALQQRKQLLRSKKPVDAIDIKLARDYAQAQTRAHERHARHALVATCTFDDALPISAKRADIAALIAQHQVVVLCGETGSGKTTQLPKICLELGRGKRGLIGCTQPRRIAARSLSTRLSQELGVYGQQSTAFKIRFNDRTDANTLVKIMTDGVLLSEIHSDPQLLAYDTLIIDEAHERSLNIDFLLGYVKQLLPQRPDLKIIITSATIDPARFSKHFNNAPVIEVSGRTYPVEVRYRPEYYVGKNEEALDVEDAVSQAVDELLHETSEGDVLVFLPGEREIRDCAEALRKHHHALEVLPLFARLSNAEQDRIFQTNGRRRVVLATNVAETSLTVPGVRYVVDVGVARINRYSARSKIDLLQIEPISQASAQQRAGRCGRVANGICIRLYAEEDFTGRTAFTTPEILRTSLASVILRMIALDLGQVENFPFVEPPSSRMIEDGFRQLFELGAVDSDKQLTSIGRTLATFPIDPAIARMLLAGHKGGCLKDVLIIASALSVQDPRDRPLEKQQEAMLAHEKFVDPQSEFIGFLNMWQFFEAALTHKMSHRKLDQHLRASFLSPMRMREWRDVHAQLSEQCEKLDGNRLEAPENRVPSGIVHRKKPPIEVAGTDKISAQYEGIHRALLTGLLGNVGMKAIEGDHFMGTRGIKFQLPQRAQQHASQKQNRMKWLMAAEITETTRIYARTAARIEPEWIEESANHLVTRTHFDAHWERKSGQVIAFEQVSLYGLIINPKKRVHFGSINPKEAREIMIRQGLVPGEFDTHAKFLQTNLALVTHIEDLEAKARRQDVLIDEQALFELYDARIPADIVNAQGFEKWRKQAETTDPNVLLFTMEVLMRRAADEITVELYPKFLKHKGATYAMKYRFEPSHPLDGVTITLPVSVLNQVDPKRFEWLVPGMLREKVAMLIKCLPQRLRSPLVPVPDSVTAFMQHLDNQTTALAKPRPDELELMETFKTFVKRYRGLDIPPADWNLGIVIARMPPHLLMNFIIVDADGKELATGRDFGALQAQFKEASKTVFSTLHRNRMEREGIKTWDFGDLPETINFERDGIRYDGYPAVVDTLDSVAIRIFDQQRIAEREHRRGLARLFMLECAEACKQVVRNITVSPIAAFQYSGLYTATKNHALEALRQELLIAAINKAFLPDFNAPRLLKQADFSQRRDTQRSQLGSAAKQLAAAFDEALVIHADIRTKLADRFISNWEHVGEDILSQLKHLLPPHILQETDPQFLLQYPRYFKAIVMRLDKIKKGAMERDLELTQQMRGVWKQWQASGDKQLPLVTEYRWMVEELRVGLFAQELRTAYPVSVKRLAKFWDENKLV